MPQPRASVVLVEDEPEIASWIAHELGQAGFVVKALRCGDEAMAAVLESDASVVLLDRMLPDAEGIEVCRLLRADPRCEHVGVLILTGRGAEDDRIDGFQAGADDYVVKPFRMGELLARVRILIRLAGDRRKAPSSRPAPVYRWRELIVDVGRHVVLIAGEEVALRRLEFLLLTTMFEQPQRIWSRRSMIEKVWGREVAVSTRTIDVHVRRLRERLGPLGDVVETVHGGYRLRRER